MTETVLMNMAIAFALLYAFLNGQNDAANSVATLISSRAVRPWKAFAWAALFNFAAFFLFGDAVARTVSEGLVEPAVVTEVVVLSACLAAVVWIAGSSLAGLPINASHALIGGFGGAAAARTAYLYGWDSAFSALIPSGWLKVVGFAVLAPLVGYFLGRRLGPPARRKLVARPDRSRQMQLTAAAALSLSHGLNDAQTAAALIATSLVATGHQIVSEAPAWAALSSHAALALGVLLGSRRVVRRVGDNLTRLRLADGSAAQAGAAAAVVGSSLLGAPVSATHALAGAVAGVGASKPRAAVRWRTAVRILQVWLLTFPASAALGAVIYGVGLRLIALSTGR